MKVSWDNRINSYLILIRMWILLSLIMSYYKFDNKDNLPKNTHFLFVFQEKLPRSICISDSHDNVLCDLNFISWTHKYKKQTWHTGAQPPLGQTGLTHEFPYSPFQSWGNSCTRSGISGATTFTRIGQHLLE